MAIAIYMGTDHRVSIPKLTDHEENVVTGATVTMTLFESDATTEVSGTTWPITLSDDGDGAYSGTLPDGVSLTENATYWLKLSAESGSTKRTWWQDVVARRGGF